MSEKNRSSSNVVEADADNKLKQYMQINKQISRQLTTQRIEIANLKHTLRASDCEIFRLRIECNKWKTKYETLTNLYVTHVTSVTTVLQSNADTFSKLSEKSVDERCNSLISQVGGSPEPVSQKVDGSRRVSKSFDSVKNRSQRRNSESFDIHTIEEQDENDVSAERNIESEGTSYENETIIDNNKEESDGDSKEILDEIERSLQTNNEILDESQLSEEESRTIGEVGCVSDEETGESGEESDVSGTSGEECRENDEESGVKDLESSEGEEEGEHDKESGRSDAESGRSDAESGRSDAESGRSDAESGRSDAESGRSDAESGRSDAESGKSDEEIGESDEEVDVGNKVHEETEASGQEDSVLNENSDISVVDNEDASESQYSSEEESEDVSDAENNSTDPDVASATEDSTIMNDDSRENTSAKHSVSKNTSSIISVDSTLDKSTPIKSTQKLSKNKKKVNASDQSISLTYGNMEEKSLVSSTPYRNNSSGSDASVDPTVPVRSQSQSSTLSTESSTSQTSTSTSNGSIASSRPKRKAAPVVLSEPKLNTKLRRPR